MRKLTALSMVFFCAFLSCKTSEIISPASNINGVLTEEQLTDEIQIQSNQLVHLFAKLIENDSIKTEIILLAGKGLGNYYWVPLEKLAINLKNKYGIILNDKANNFLLDYYDLEPGIDHYTNYINSAIAKGLSPHLYIPNLEKFVITNSEQEEDGMLDVDINSASNLKLEHIINYQLFDEGTSYFSSTIYSKNNFTETSIQLGYPCDYPVMFVTYRIVNIIDFTPCDYDNNTTVYSCIFHDERCKICEETQPHNNNVNIFNLTPPVGAIEMRINIDRFSDDYSCYNDKIYPLTIEATKESFGFLKTIPNLDYFHPITGTVISGYTNMKNIITRNPIYVKNLMNNQFYNANKISLCLTSNDFRVLGDAIGQNVLGAGIYRVTRLNGLPYYFVFPGNVYGSMMFNSGADGVVEYNLNDNNSQTCNNPLVKSLQEEMNVSSICRFCGPTNNSLGVEVKDVASNSLSDLINFWYNNSISVGIVLEAVNSRTPNQNILTFNSDAASNNNCINPPANMTLVAQLTKNGDEFDQLKYFTVNNGLVFFNSGTSFYIEVSVSFLDGNSINQCGTINAISNSSGGQLKAAAIFPRGNLNSLNINIYKIN